MCSLIVVGACLCYGTQASSSQSVYVSSAAEGFISRVLSNIVFLNAKMAQLLGIANSSKVINLVLITQWSSTAY